MRPPSPADPPACKAAASLARPPVSWQLLMFRAFLPSGIDQCVCPQLSNESSSIVVTRGALYLECTSL